jgi:phage baseplate assembly protein W
MTTRKGAITAPEAFLGRGWSFPPSFDRLHATVSMAEAEQDIRECLWVLLSTSLGERVMLATYGCDLMSKVFTTLTTTTANEICALVAKAILDWEPRITVEDIAVAELDEKAGWITIDIAYKVRKTNTRSNLVYPFCRLEATLPPVGG